MSDEFNADLLSELVVTASRVDPQNPVFIDPTPSYQDIMNDYRLEETPLENGLLWRVNAAGIPHPDDAYNFCQQLEILRGLYTKPDPIPGSSEIEFTLDKVVVEAKRADNTTYFKKVPDYTTVNYKGKVYNIYVPWSGNDMNSGGWRTVDTYSTTLKEFSFSKFVSGFSAADPKVKPIIESGDKIVYTHRPNAEGVKNINALSLLFAANESAAKALQITPIQVIKQEKDNESRIIVQVGLNRKYFQENAGKMVIPSTGNDGAWNVLTGNKTFRLTFDAQHAHDPFTAYISINDYGQFVLTPKVYSGDKMEVGHSGFWGTSDFKEILISPAIISKDGPFKSIAEKLEEIFSQ